MGFQCSSEAHTQSPFLHHHVELTKTVVCELTGSCLQSSVPWLQFCFRMYTALGDRVLSSEDGCQRDHVEAIKAALLSTLMQAHLRRGYFPQEVCFREVVYELQHV